MLYTYHLGLAWAPGSASHLHQSAYVILLGSLERVWPKSATLTSNHFIVI